MWILICYGILALTWLILLLIAKWIPLMVFNILISITFGFAIYRIIDNYQISVYKENHAKEYFKRNYKRVLKENQDIIENYEKTYKDKLLEAKQEAESLRNKLQAINCIKCGKPSNGKHFCYDCYQELKNRTLDVRLKNCFITEVLDAYGNKTILCENNTFVRSRAEALITNFLFGHKIRYIYEKPIYHNGNTLHPDFYLPDYNVFIEYNELNNDEYMQKKNYALNIYRQKRLKVYIMNEQDLCNIEAFFEKIINQQARSF